MSLLRQIVFAAALLAAVASLRADIIWSGDRAIHLSYLLVGDEPPTAPPPEGEYGRSYLDIDLNDDGMDDIQVGDLFFDDHPPLWFYAVSQGGNKHTGDWIGQANSIIDGSQPNWTGGEHLLVSWMLLLDDGQAGVGAWLGQTGYMGVQFEANDGMHFGWVHMTVYAEHPGMTIHGWAYESTPGAGVVTGMVPEPSSALLAVIGGLAAWNLRRCRKRTQGD